jgi:alkylhydroperoxidase/carboxymuconolactone decarboxylase family protein YurZ
MTEGTPVLDTLVQMNEGTLERSGLDPGTYMLARIAALAASGAPPVSYLANLEAASELGVTPEQVQGVLVAIAPVVGGAAVAAAAGSITRALGITIELGELAEEADATS